jgi:hypothetical protein
MKDDSRKQFALKILHLVEADENRLNSLFIG